MGEKVLIWLVYALAGFVVVATLLPLVRRDAWWIRAFEFPRLQILVLAVGVLAVGFASGLFGGGAALLAGAVAASALLQAGRILPFTPLWHRQDSQAVAEGGGTLGVLVANVLMTNRDSARFLALVRDLDPDLVLAVEADRWWCEALEPLAEAYPHRIEHPRENTYGIVLYSKHRLEAGEVRFLVTDDVPSIRCRVAGPKGRRTTFYGLHPRPPAPQEATDTTERDAELLLVAKEVHGSTTPTIVAGDLNDVAWSYTTRLFRRISGLLDPRIGRGLYATFPAARPWLRFPLDHVFHSAHFGLLELRLGPDVGSDHLPMYARFRVSEEAPELQEEPEPTGDDLALAREKIAEGLEPDESS